MLLELPIQPAAFMPQGEIFRLSVAHYHEMIRLGIFRDGDGVELLDGLLYRKSPMIVPTPLGMVNVTDLFPLTLA